MEFLVGFAVIAIIIALFYYYGKFIGNLLIKREKKRIAEKTPTDKEILRLYKNYNPSNAFIFFLFGIVC